jgi:hypothetical protein
MATSYQSLGFALSSLEDFESPALADLVIRLFFDVTTSLRAQRFGVYEPAEQLAGDGAPVAMLWKNLIAQRGRGEPGLGSVVLENQAGARYQIGWH